MSASSDIAAIRELLECLVDQGQPARINTRGGVVPERILSKAMTAGFDRMASPAAKFSDPRAASSAIRGAAVPVVDGGFVDVYFDLGGGLDRIAVFGLSTIAYAEQSSTFVKVKHVKAIASATFNIDRNRGWAEQVEAVVEWLAPVPS